MTILLVIVISLVLGFNMGVQHERKKYICLEDPEQEGEDEIVMQRPKESIGNKMKKSIKKNLF